MGSFRDRADIAGLSASRPGRRSGKRVGLFGMIFGCRHREMSRPFTVEGESYTTCLECGARKAFDTKSLRTFGPYYYPSEGTRFRGPAGG